MSKDKAPPYEKIDIPALDKMARDYAREGYAWSDKDWATRFPEFPKGRDFAIDNANLNLSGAVDPLVSGTLNQSGLGMVDLRGNSFEQSRNLGQPILAKEQRDRNYFQRLLTDPLNQPRGDLAGLSGKNIAEIRAVESGNKINYDWANFGTNINQYNAQTQQANALSSTLGRLAGGIAQTGAGALSNGQQSTPYTQSNYLNPGFYNYVPQGGYYNPGFAPSQYGGMYEGNISGQPVYRAEPVSGNYNAPGTGTDGGGP